MWKCFELNMFYSADITTQDKIKEILRGLFDQVELAENISKQQSLYTFTKAFNLVSIFT